VGHEHGLDSKNTQLEIRLCQKKELSCPVVKKKEPVSIALV
jgi:hypothetical protein